MKIEKISISQLKFSGYNPRKDLKAGDAEYEKLKSSICEFGYVEPIIWNKTTGRIVGGHQRIKVLIELGEKDIDCVVLELDETRERALNIALNRISGEWDIPKLTDLIKDLENNGFNLEITGFDLKEIQDLFNTQISVDAVEDDSFNLAEELNNITVPITRNGDVYVIGEHRVMCGDSCNNDDVNFLMNGTAADLVVTDPPYNVNYSGGKKKRQKIENDNLQSEEFKEFLQSAFARLKDCLKNGCSFYMFYSSSESLNFLDALKATDLSVREILIWNKNTLVLGRQDYHYKHEPILYGWKDGAAHNWYSDRKQTTVLDFDKPARCDEHPTMKPIKLLAYLIRNSSKAGDIVLDLFGGSGSTLIACEQLKRTCYIMEKDEKYCDVIIERYKKFFGDSNIQLIRKGGDEF